MRLIEIRERRYQNEAKIIFQMITRNCLLHDVVKLNSADFTVESTRLSYKSQTLGSYAVHIRQVI